MNALLRHKKGIYGFLSAVGCWSLAYIFYIDWVVGRQPTELQAWTWGIVTASWLLFGMAFVQYDSWKTNRGEAE